MKKPMSFRTAIIGLFTAVILIMVLMLARSLTVGYHTLAEQQANTVISLMDAKAHVEVVHLLENPRYIGQIYAKWLSGEEFYRYSDFGEVEAIISTLVKEIHETIPQITTIGYGDENGNFIGVRANEDRSYTLMVKDDQTGNQLLIYAGETRDTPVAAAYDGYDVRSRPWYAPVRENPVVQWSDLYINMDDLQDATLSSLIPIFDRDERHLVGVVSVDISLVRINRFLGDTAEAVGGIMYIVDDTGALISHSTPDPVYRMEDTTGEARFLKAEDSADPVIHASAAFLSASPGMRSFQAGNQSYYMKVSELGQPAGVSWRLVTVVPEQALVGNIRARFVSMAGSYAGVALAVLVIGIAFLLLFLSSVTKIATQLRAVRLTEEHLDSVSVQGLHFKETDELLFAFNQLLHRLGENMQARLAAQKEMDRMTEEENTRLENLVRQKTEELQTAMDELVEKEKLASLGSLVAGISHEVNTPIGVAVTATTYLQSLIAEWEDAKQEDRDHPPGNMEAIHGAVEIVIRNLERARDLVTSFKKISVDPSGTDRARFSLQAYIRLTLASLSHALKTHQVQVLVTGEDAEVFLNPGSMAQVLSNLVMNALHHGFKGRDSGEITIHTERQADQLVMTVSDNGTGIDPAHIGHVFDPFFTTSRGSGRSGLGLSIVRNTVVSDFKGTIRASNRPEGGACFLLRFPLDEAEQ